MELGLYIHIPFCLSKCIYCDFASFPNLLDRQAVYFQHLEKEIEASSTKVDSSYEVTSIYFGGGTPSVVESKYIEAVLETIKSCFKVSESAEITIEINPKTLNMQKAEHYKAMGINRVSVGLQTHREDILKLLKRAHSFNDFLETIEILKMVGFENISSDLIYGLPEQSLEDIEKSIEILGNLDIQHISYYSLTIMEHTALEQMLAKNQVTIPDEELNRQMYHKGIEWLLAKGFKQYEISNFCKADKASAHNLKYWDYTPYLGFGVAAHSFLEGKRWGNTENFRDYLESLGRGELPQVEIEVLEREESIYEYVMLRLRLNEGLFFETFEEKFGQKVPGKMIDTLEKYIEHGLVEKSDKGLRLTTEGFDVSNTIFCELMDF